MSDPYGDPLPPGHGERWDEWTSEPVPVCPACGGQVRRDLAEFPVTGWRCTVHGAVNPEWTYPQDEEEE